MILAQQTLATAAQRVYFCPSLSRAEVRFFRFSNTSTNTATVRVLHLRNNETATATRQIIVPDMVMSGSLAINVGGVPIEGGEAIWMLASSTNVAVTMYGEETPTGAGGRNGR